MFYFYFIEASNNYYIYTLNRIKELCDERGWSIYRLAKEADIPYSLNNIFVRNTHPTVPTLEKICCGLKISLSEFFDSNTPCDFKLRYNTLSSEEMLLIETFNQLSFDDKKILIAYAHGLARKL